MSGAAENHPTRDYLMLIGINLAILGVFLAVLHTTEDSLCNTLLSLIPIAAWGVLIYWAAVGMLRDKYDDPRATGAGRLLCRLFPAVLAEDIRLADADRLRDEQSRGNDG